MKKLITILVAFTMISGILISCADSDPSTTLSTNDFQASQNETEYDKEPSVLIEDPPADYIYHFDTYLDVKQALSTTGSTEYTSLRNEQHEYGTIYQQTLSTFDSGNAKIAIPKIDGKAVALENREGYSNIDLLTCDLYNLPWIWYHCIVGEDLLDIKVSYLCAINTVEFSPDYSYYDILSVIAPNAPSPNNFEQFESYQSIYELPIHLHDGSETLAIISDLKDSTKSYVMFRYEDILVCVHGEKKFLTESFWNSFSIDFE